MTKSTNLWLSKDYQEQCKTGLIMLLESHLLDYLVTTWCARLSFPLGPGLHSEVKDQLQEAPKSADST